MIPSTAINDLFERLARSKFRAKFRLDGEDARYVHARGIEAVCVHAAEIIAERLAPAANPKDGKQTPWRGHPVFVAQHATATCCRGCLAKWHGIAKGHAMSADEQRYVIGVLTRWIEAQTREQTVKRVPTLFD